MSDILGDRRRATWLLALLIATASLPASPVPVAANAHGRRLIAWSPVPQRFARRHRPR